MASPADSLWDEYDFEGDAAKRVQEFLDEAADSLFRDSVTPVEKNADLAQWERFPHIRVRGSQCYSPQQESVVVAPLIRDAGASLPEAVPQELAVMGGHCPRQSQEEVDMCEEVFASHGVVEEIIAISEGCEEEGPLEEPDDSELLTQLCEFVWANVVSGLATTLREKHSSKPPRTACGAAVRATYTTHTTSKRPNRPSMSARSRSSMQSSTMRWNGIKDFGVVVQQQQLHHRTRKESNMSATTRGSVPLMNKSASEPTLNAAACVRLSNPPPPTSPTSPTSPPVVWAQPSTAARKIQQKPARLPNLVQVRLPSSVHRGPRTARARDSLRTDSFLPDIVPKPHQFHPNRRGVLRRH